MASVTSANLLNDLEFTMSQSQEELNRSQKRNETKVEMMSQDTMSLPLALRPASTDTVLPGLGNVFMPPPSAQLVKEDENRPPLAPYSKLNLQSIEDFDRENPYTPAVGRKPQMIAFRTKSGSVSVVKFQQKCDQLGIRPVFSFHETAGGFAAVVTFGADAPVTAGSYPSKKEAKEAVCELALGSLPNVEESKQGTKRKSSVAAVEPHENWVGILQNYAQSKRQALPVYEESFTSSFPIKFGCQVTIEDRFAAPFGSNIWPYNSKKEAKTKAARDAVLWLRETGKLVATDSKRRKTSIAEADSPGRTGLTQGLQDAGIEAASTQSLPSIVNSRALALGLQAPSFDFKPSMTPSGKHAPGAYQDVAARFSERDISKEPRLAGAIGQVHGVYGSKAAKNACCIKVLQVLQEIELSRENPIS